MQRAGDRYAAQGAHDPSAMTDPLQRSWRCRGLNACTGCLQGRRPCSRQGTAVNHARQVVPVQGRACKALMCHPRGTWRGAPPDVSDQHQKPPPGAGIAVSFFRKAHFPQQD